MDESQKKNANTAPDFASLEYPLTTRAFFKARYKIYIKSHCCAENFSSLMLLFRVMKRLLLILLLAILPLQATWAAVGTYCQHEKGVKSRHFGHHEHEHQHAQAEEQQKDSSIKFHTDCITCHGAAAAMITPVVSALPVEPMSSVFALPYSHLSSIPSSRPEKPKWVLAV